MKTVKGDLIQLAKDGEFDVIIHGCNCYCAMGAGIAKSIKQHFPEAYKADCKTKKGDKKKLGTYTFAEYHITGTEKPFQKLRVINGYTQYNYAKGLINVDYDAIRSVFRKMKEDFGGQRLRFGYPLIGCGLAGGDWNIVKEIIEEELAGEDHTLVVFLQ